MSSTILRRLASRSAKRAPRRPARCRHRALRLEVLETRQLLTVASAFVITGFPTSASTPYEAGTPETVTVQAVDASGKPASGYQGTIHFASSDPNALLPADYKFKASDGGTQTFSITLYATGSNKWVSVTDTSNSTLTGKETVPKVGPSTAVRYSSSSNTIYVVKGTMTLTTLHLLLPKAPPTALALVDPVNKTWELGANLVIQNGAALQLHGTSIGGDVNQLRLMSDNLSTGKVFVSIIAKYGTIDTNSVGNPTTGAAGITSWDDAANGPDTNFQNGRAYLRVSSMLASDNVTPLESTMNIVNSDIGYLGYYHEEGYGLSWKVEGNPGPGHGAISNVHVFGNIENDAIHDNFFGVYTYGLQGNQGAFTSLKLPGNASSGLFTGNEVYDNVGYGFDMHNYSDGILVDGNNVHDNGLSPTQYHIGWTYYENSSLGPPGGYTPKSALFAHGIIFSIGCVGNVISNNQSVDNLGHGIMLHRDNADNTPADSALVTKVTGNHVSGNTQEGIAIFDSNNAQINNNWLYENTLDGLRFTVGSANNSASGNYIHGNGGYGIELFPGNDKPVQGGNGHPNHNTLSNNLVDKNMAGGISVQDADSNTFQGNTLHGNGGPAEALFNLAVDNVLSGNSFINPATGAPDANAILASTGSSTIKTNTIISAQPSLKVSLDANSTLTYNSSFFSLVPASATMTLHLRVGGLAPNKSYSVWRNNNTLIGSNFIANASGLIQFSDLPGTTAVVTYNVQ